MESNHLPWKVALSFVIPSEAEGSAVTRTPPGNVGNSEIRVRTYAQMEPRPYFRWIVIPEEIRSRFWSLPARLGSRVYP
jgi:hypothetical protein